MSIVSLKIAKTICFVAIAISPFSGVMLGDSGMVDNGSLITAFRDAYQSFFENYSNTLMNLDAIPDENP